MSRVVCTGKRKRTISYGLGDFVGASELKPKPGDLIEIDRTLYVHWVVYIGNGEVVHVQDLNQKELNNIPLSSKAVVKISKLTDVAGNSSVRVNNKDVPAKERGYAAINSDKLLAIVKKQVGKTVNYNLLTRNCEHMVTEWKYGKAWSDQADTALSFNGQLAEQKDRGHQLWLNGLTTLLSHSPPQQTPAASNSTKSRTTRAALRHSNR